MKKIIKRIIVIVLILIVVLSVAFGLYVHDAYQPTEAAYQILNTANRRRYDNHEPLIFKPKGKIKAAFVFYPGGKVDYLAYAPLMSDLSGKGIFCVLPHMTFNLAMFSANAAKKPRKRYKKIKKWYIGGHSLGGVAAASYAYEHQEDYTGMIFLASYTTASFKDSKLTALSVYGSQDKVLNKKSYTKNKKNFPPHTREEIIKGGCHGGFGSYGHQKGDGEPSISAKRQQAITATIIADYIEN